jgi:toxin ParE1/3/4
VDRPGADTARGTPRLHRPGFQAARTGHVERILDRAETPLVAPRSGVRLQAFVDDEVRELLERPYRIIYRVSAAGIEILTVKHYRQRLIDRPEDF